jgi:glucokinase
MSWAAGIDIGGTNVKVVAVAPDGSLRGHITRVTDDGAAQPADWMRAAGSAVAALTDQEGERPKVIGGCAPGLAAADERSIAHLPGKLKGLAGIDWTDALRSRAKVPVLNDGHAALLGEAWCGAARGRRNVVMLTLGTGIGGAVMCDGKLLRGAIGRAGHIGHMSLDPEGPVSITGMPGAIEMLAGDCTVAARSGRRFLNTAALVLAYRAGDAEATRIWLQSVRALGTAVGSCINLFDPELVVIGGGIAQAGPELFEPLGREVARVVWRPLGRGVPLVAAELGEWAGAIGAAWHAWQAPAKRPRTKS